MGRRPLASCALLLLALITGCAPALAAAATPPEDSIKTTMDNLRGWVKHDFELPDGLPIDAALRASAQSMADEQTKQIETLLRSWAATEATGVAPSRDANELAMRLLARYLNEMALWQLDTTDATYDRQMLQALMQPGLCARQADQPPWAKVVLAIQHMPQADRQQALDAQARLLKRWGLPRPSVPVRPVPSLLEQAEPAVRALGAANRPAGEPPLPPRLAWVMVGTQQRRVTDDDRCLMRWWWLQREQAAALANPGAFMRAVRYASLADPMKQLRLEAETDRAADNTYPKSAARLGIEGRVVVSGMPVPNATGLSEPRVVQRELTVPGIRDVRAVAFETVFDAASLARARAVTLQEPVQGRRTQVEFVWKLQP